MRNEYHFFNRSDRFEKERHTFEILFSQYTIDTKSINFCPADEP